jgi:glycosyltransferase involved in cell wall biosynthesis
MKLAICTDHLLYWNGGVKYIYEVTRRLAKDYDVSLIAQAISSANEELFSKTDVQILDMDETTANKLRYWLFYPYYLLKHALILREAQARYGFDVWISISPTTHILCWIAGIKPISVVFELNPWLYSDSYRKGLSKLKLFIVNCGGIVAKWMERKAYHNASRLIAQSKFVQSEIKRVFGLDSTVVYAGVDTDFFKPTHNPELEVRYKDKQVVLHVASYLSPMKGTDLAVEAMGLVNKEFPDALLLVINSHNDVERQKELSKKAVECGAKIEFVVGLIDEQMPEYYTLAKCVLSPSLDENVHWPVMEGASCETPCVILRGHAEPEDMIHARTGYMDVNKWGMAAWIKRLLDNTQFGLGKLARQFILERFNWDKSIEIYKRLISEVIEWNG